MPARVVTVALSVISASLGFVAGYAAPHAGRATATQAPESPALPLPPPSAVPAPAPAPTTIAKLKPAPLPVARIAPTAPLSTERPSRAAEPAMTARTPSPLAGFRFAGVGPAGGLRLARVRPNTLPAALGLQSGDELLSINQFRLSDPEQALTAYARLRYANRLELAIRRNGQPAAIVYSVR